MSTIFSKIITREVPATIVYEDEHVLAFLDIKPINPGHTLVIPKTPFENIFDGTPDNLAHMMKVAQKIGQALVAAKLAEGVNIIMNNGAVASQEVFHAHLHVVPRLPNDHAFTTPKHTEVTPHEMMSLAQKISAQLK